MQNIDIAEFEDGDVKLWVEQGAIHMAAYDKKRGDPIELTSDTARQIARKLDELADSIDQ